MENNDILRRLRYTFDLKDSEMVRIYRSTGHSVSREQMADWLKKDEESDYKEMTDEDLATFLNGFINEKRGKREGSQPAPEKRLNNNLVLRKLKIALELKDTDILKILELASISFSKHELSAFFRKPGQKQYRECRDQFLRNFLLGLQKKYRA